MNAYLPGDQYCIEEESSHSCQRKSCKHLKDTNAATHGPVNVSNQFRNMSHINIHNACSAWLRKEHVKQCSLPVASKSFKPDDWVKSAGSCECNKAGKSPCHPFDSIAVGHEWVKVGDISGFIYNVCGHFKKLSLQLTAPIECSLWTKNTWTHAMNALLDEGTIQTEVN